jgi:hypothetical protein
MVLILLNNKRFHPSKWITSKANIYYPLAIEQEPEEPPSQQAIPIQQDTTVEDLQGAGFVVRGGSFKGGSMKTQPQPTKNDKLRKFISLNIR